MLKKKWMVKAYNEKDYHYGATREYTYMINSRPC
jgi:hypothetical protein